MFSEGFEKVCSDEEPGADEEFVGDVFDGEDGDADADSGARGFGGYGEQGDDGFERVDIDDPYSSEGE